MLKVRITRSFFERGVQHNVGDVKEFHDTFARELCATNKAQLVPVYKTAAQTAEPATMTTQSAEALVKGKAAQKERP